MNRILLKLIINTLSVFIAGLIMGDAVQLDSFWTAVLVALVLSVFNVTLKPLLIFLTLPATLVTFGLFLFVVNAFIIMAADYLITGFTVINFWYALLFSLILSIINALLFSLGEHQNRPQ